MVLRTNNYFTDYEDTGFGDDALAQNQALAAIINPPVAPTPVATPVASTPVAASIPAIAAPAATPANPTFADLLKAYNQQGATTTTSYENEQGTQYNTNPNDLGGGWNAWEKPAPIVGYEGQGMDATPIYGKSELGGFSQKDGDYVNFYDLNGKLVDRQKWNESALKSAWNDIGPVAMAALTMGGGAGMLGNALFGLEGAAAAGAGGALGGAFNAGMNDQNILTGALKGGLSSAGALKLGDTGITLGDVNKAVNFIENPSLAGALNVAAPAVGDVKIGDGAISLNDVAKSLNTAQALSSGNPQQIFNAIVGLDRSASTPLKTSLGPGDAQEFSDNLIPGYFQPGGAGYIAPEDTNPITVQQEPFNIDELLSQLDQFKQSAVTAEDIQNIISGQNYATPEDIQTAINTIDIPKGMSEQDVQTIVSNEFAKNPNIKIEDVQSVVDEAVSKIPAGLTATDVTDILGRQNYATPEDIQTAINTIDIPKGLSEQDVQAIVSNAFAENPGINISDVQSVVDAAVSKIPTGVSQEDLAGQLSGLRSGVTSEISDTNQKITDVAQALGTTKEELMNQLNVSQEELQSIFGEQISGLQNKFTSDITDTNQQITDIADALGTTKEDLINQITSQGEDFTGQISGLQEKVTSGISDTNQKITDVAEALGTTKEALLEQLNVSESELRDLIGSESSGLRDTFKTQIEDTNQQIADVAESLGTTKEDLINRLNVSDTELRDLIGSESSSLRDIFKTQIEDVNTQVTDIATALGTTKEDLLDRLNVSESELRDLVGSESSALRDTFKTQIGDVNTQITSIADALGTTEEALMNQLNVSDAELRDLIGSEVSGLRGDIKTQIEDTNQQITNIADALGTTEEELMNRLNLSESELRDLIGNVGTQTQTALANQAKAQAAQNTALSNALSQAQSTANLNTLMMLMNDGQQPVQQTTMQDPYADIKLMEDLFGSEIDLTPAGENTARRK